MTATDEWTEAAAEQRDTRAEAAEERRGYLARRLCELGKHARRAFSWL
jgi:hypothetical protein